MATNNSVTKNQKTNIIVITGNDETFQNLLSIIRKSDKCGELSGITRSVESTIEQLETTQLPLIQQIIPLPQNVSLTLDDYNRLNSVKLSYDIAFRLTTTKQTVSAFDHINDRRSGLLYSTSLLYDLGMKLITFIRSIPEFEFLNEQDRFILFKYNSPLVLYMRICLCYDIDRDLVFDPEVQSEEYAIVCKQLSQYCFGKQLDSASTQLFRSIKNVTDDDPIILQLMLIILTFTKSLSVENIVENEQSTFMNSKQVDEAQSIYAKLRAYIDNVYVTIETDHKPLENCHRKQINNKRVINWLFKLQDLISQIVEVKYRINLGAKNTTANYISRHFPLSCKPTSLTEHFYFC
ncbi:unnamed protein product [Adineta steineri]|uniref:Uncharacterized protein n=1 Tax=Adineta steineri TaxID=433720 RepID=A0A813TYB3_9BILA|nr:unnamed protein product [Adineta steineri]